MKIFGAPGHGTRPAQLGNVPTKKVTIVVLAARLIADANVDWLHPSNPTSLRTAHVRPLRTNVKGLLGFSQPLWFVPSKWQFRN